MKEDDVIVSIESFFQQSPSYEWIQALEDTILYGITFNQLQHIYRTYSEFNSFAKGIYYYRQAGDFTDAKKLTIQ